VKHGLNGEVAARQLRTGKGTACATSAGDGAVQALRRAITDVAATATHCPLRVFVKQQANEPASRELRSSQVDTLNDELDRANFENVDSLTVKVDVEVAVASLRRGRLGWHPEWLL
jgi:hypothetical protein